VPHIRIFRHYIHAPLVFLAMVETAIAGCAAYLGYFTRYQHYPELVAYLPPAVTFALVLVVCMSAMGVYEARVREGMVGMSLRTAVGIFLLGTAAVAVLFFLFPAISMGRGELLFAAIEAFLLISVFRWIFFRAVDENSLKRRVVVLGTGRRALKIASRMRRRYDQRAFVLVGFLQPSGNRDDLVSEFGARVMGDASDLPRFCEEYDVHEIVVAMDERRRNQDASGGLPLEDLMECRLRGIQVCDVQQFIEREACKVDVDLLRPSWMVFSDGFIAGTWRTVSKRAFDLLACLLLLAVAWPVMLLTALLIRLEDGAPVFYRQTRIGLDDKPFDVIKFRSMRTDAEASGEAVWASQNDPRVTRVGAFIRKTRIDELPQLFNVLRGDMSFVGPRPERPMFVEELKCRIPFYEQRHRVKPGITGWAQLCYPYGASVQDAKEKLQYDLYYLKNHSLLLDLIILLQTVEVVLVGEGAR
jgi:sugar transferase (PEP-CTERM system associated)